MAVSGCRKNATDARLDSVPEVQDVSHPVVHQFESNWNSVAARIRETGWPVLVVFRSEDCFYCERLDEEVITPLYSRNAENPFVVIREFDIHTGSKLVDFDGERIRSRIFVSRCAGGLNQARPQAC